MPFYILYILKLSVSLSVVWMFYRLFLQRLTFYTWNRWYLLIYSLLSFVIPLVNITPWMEKQSFSEGQIINYIPVLPTGAGTTALSSDAGIESGSFITSGWDLLVLVLLAGAGVLLIRLLIRVMSFRKIRRKATLIEEGMEDKTVKLYHVEENIIPFSFGNAIYINHHLHTEKEWEEIVLHEYVHVRQRHTIDILFAEWLCILNWYNPFAWLIRFAIRQNLEFIADHKVIENGSDRKAYQYHLLKVVGSQPYRIANSFNFSSLKKRIIMMNRIKSARVQLVKFLFLLPLMAVLLLAFRDQYKDVFSGRKTKTSLQANVAGLVIDISMHKPLAGVEVRDRISGMSTVTDKNGYYKIVEPMEKDSAGVARYKGGSVQLVFSKGGYHGDDRRMPSPAPAKGSFGWIFIIPMIPDSGSTAVFIQAPSPVDFPEDPGYEDVLGEFRKVEHESADWQLSLKMRRNHPEVSDFYMSENRKRHIVVLKDGRVEKYGYPGSARMEEMEKKYGPLPAMITQSPQQVSDSYLTRWEGIADKLEKSYHTANPDARRIIFPGDSRILVLDRSGNTRMFDMEGMAPEERQAFEKLYGKLPDFVPASSVTPVHSPSHAPSSSLLPSVSNHPVSGSAPGQDRPIGVSGRVGNPDTMGPGNSYSGAGYDGLLNSVSSNLKSDIRRDTFPQNMLYIFNGVQMPEGWSPKSIPDSNIQSVDVVKGEMAVSLFGSRGVNGVIAITTKISGSTLIRLRDPGVRQPLYVVDGIEEDSAQVSKIPPSEIQSVLVLKGEEAEKRYGREKAKNGVVVISLKKAAGAASVKASSISLQFDSKSHKPTPLFVVNGQQMDSAQVMKIPPGSIDSLVVFGDDAIQRYGDKGRNGVMQIHLKNPAPPTF
jgi:TonB-dependent SusC/RagA subfamily outer membrane receptor